jgi:hypothetical protein
MRRWSISLAAAALLIGALGTGAAVAKHNPGKGKTKNKGTPSMSVFATGSTTRAA